MAIGDITKINVSQIQTKDSSGGGVNRQFADGGETVNGVAQTGADGELAIFAGSGNDGAIQTDLIANSTSLTTGVTAAKLAANTVTSDNFAAGAVDFNEIANNAVSALKIQDSSSASTGVTTDKLADDSVTADGIKDSTGVSDGITGDKFEAGGASSGVVSAKFAGDGGGIPSGKFAANTIVSANFGTGAVYGDRIVDGDVTVAKLGNLSNNDFVYTAFTADAGSDSAGDIKESKIENRHFGGGGVYSNITGLGAQIQDLNMSDGTPRKIVDLPPEHAASG